MVEYWRNCLCIVNFVFYILIDLMICVYGFCFWLVFFLFVLIVQFVIVQFFEKKLLDLVIYDIMCLEIINGILVEMQVSDLMVVWYNKQVVSIIFWNFVKKNFIKKEWDIYFYYFVYWYSDKVMEIYFVRNGWKVIEYYDKVIDLLYCIGYDDEVV